MKSIITTITILFLINSIQAQSKFEPGYFINNEGIKKECLIRNKDWKYNPNEIEYKIDQSANVSIVSTKEIQVLEIVGISRYEKHKVIIDQTNEKTRDRYQILDYAFEEVEALLKVLVQGEATLYVFETKKFKRYFFSVDQSKPEQLVYKTYQRNNNKKHAESLINTKLEYCRKYKIQLYENILCGEITPDDVAKVEFKKKSLSNFFNIFNYCKGTQSVNFDDSSKRDLFNLKPRIGIGQAILTRENTTTNPYGDGETLFKLGIEMEYILPYNNGNWSVTMEPAYITVPGKDKTGTTNSQTFNYSAIQFPLGLNYGHQITSKFRIYGSISTVPELIFNAKTKNFLTKIDLINNEFYVGFAYGLGVKIYKLNFEVRRQPKTSVLHFRSSNVLFGSTYLSIGYEIN